MCKIIKGNFRRKADVYEVIEKYNGKNLLIHYLRDEDNSENVYIQEAVLYVDKNRLIIEDRMYAYTLLGCKLRIGLNQLHDYEIIDGEYDIDTYISSDYGVIQINSFCQLEF